MQWLPAMKPLLDMTPKNDDLIDVQPVAVERARRREHRARQLKGPTWALSSREADAA